MDGETRYQRCMLEYIEQNLDRALASGGELFTFKADYSKEELKLRGVSRLQFKDAECRNRLDGAPTPRERLILVSEALTNEHIAHSPDLSLDKDSLTVYFKKWHMDSTKWEKAKVAKMRALRWSGW